MTQPQRPYGPGSRQLPSGPQPYPTPAYPTQLAPPPTPRISPSAPGGQGPAADAPYDPPDTRQPPHRRRSIAWLYYSVIAVISVFAAISTGKPQVLIATALCTAYAIYLYRGGRIVLWIW